MDNDGRPKLRCMTCWQEENYAPDASYQEWGKPCIHLKTAMTKKVRPKPKPKKVEVECPETLF